MYIWMVVSPRDSVAISRAAAIHELAVELVVVSARFTRLASRGTVPTMSRALWRTLAQLDELGPLRVSDLAAVEHVSQPTASALVQRLVGHGWVERDSDPHDARAVLVRISPTGRAALQENRSAAGAALAPRLGRLDDEQRADLAAGLAALRAVLAEPQERPRQEAM